jgi:hypothetical protein
MKDLNSIYLSQEGPIRLVWALGTTFLIVFVVLVILLFALKIYRKRRLCLLEKLRKEGEQLLMHMIFEEDPEVQSVPASFLKKNNAGKMLAEILVQLRLVFSGEVSEKVSRIYFSIGLHKEALRKVKSKRYHVRVAALYELSLMNYRDMATLCMGFVNHRNEVLRRESQNILIERYGFDMLRIFKDVTFSLSDWQLMRIQNSLRKFPCVDSELEPLLRSSNATICILGVKTVADHQVYRFLPQVIALSKHSNELVRRSVYADIGTMNVYNEVALLEESLSLEQGEDTLVVLLEALTVLGSLGTVPELRRFLYSERFRIVQAALKAIQACYSQAGAIPDTDLHKEITNITSQYSLQA